MAVWFVQLFPDSFMFGFSFTDEGFDIFLGLFALSFSKG